MLVNALRYPALYAVINSNIKLDSNAEVKDGCLELSVTATIPLPKFILDLIK